MGKERIIIGKKHSLKQEWSLVKSSDFMEFFERFTAIILDLILKHSFEVLVMLCSHYKGMEIKAHRFFVTFS